MATHKRSREDEESLFSNFPDGRECSAIYDCPVAPGKPSRPFFAVRFVPHSAFPVFLGVDGNGALHWFRKATRGVVFIKFDATICDLPELQPLRSVQIAVNPRVPAKALVTLHGPASSCFLLLDTVLMAVAAFWIEDLVGCASLAATEDGVFTVAARGQTVTAYCVSDCSAPVSLVSKAPTVVWSSKVTPTSIVGVQQTNGEQLLVVDEKGIIQLVQLNGWALLPRLKDVDTFSLVKRKPKRVWACVEHSSTTLPFIGVLHQNSTGSAQVAMLDSSSFAVVNAFDLRCPVPSDTLDGVRQAAVSRQLDQTWESLQDRPHSFNNMCCFDSSGEVLVSGGVPGAAALHHIRSGHTTLIGTSDATLACGVFVSLAQASVAPTQEMRDLVGLVANKERYNTLNTERLKDSYESLLLTSATGSSARVMLMSTATPEQKPLPPPAPLGATPTPASSCDNATREAKEEIPSTLELSAPTKARITTSCGTITVKLLPHLCPRAVHNFAELALSGFYDGLTFHRVIRGFMIQGGCPKGDGTGGKSVFGAPFADEVPKDGGQRLDQFVLCMANRGPSTNESQFFITTAPTPWLQGKHSAFGVVTDGFDAIRLLEQTRTDASDKPTSPLAFSVSVP